MANQIIEIPQIIKNKISEIGRLWKNSEINPLINNDILDKWEMLITQWKNDKTIPLIIRKQSSTEPRGFAVKHNLGREIIISDNAFPQWVYYNVLHNIVFSLQEIKTMIKNDKIPISVAYNSKDKAKMTYHCLLGKYSTHKLGWKLCHKKPVKLSVKGSVQNIEMDELEKKFFLLGNPKNMFLLPLQIGYLGELDEFIEEML